MKDKRLPELDRFFESLTDKHPGAELRSSTQRWIVDMLTPSLAPVKRLPSQTVLTAQFLGVFVACTLAIVGMTGRMGFQFMTGTQIAWVALILAFGAILFSVSLASRMVPAARHFPLALVLALSGLTFFGGTGLLFPSHQSAAFVSEGLVCAITELATAVPAAVLFWLLSRRGTPVIGAGFGVVVSGLAVLLGLAVVQARCMSPNAEHLFVWHGGIAALIVAAGAIVGSAGRTDSHRWPFRS